MADIGDVLEQVRLWLPAAGGLLGATAGAFGAVWGRRSLHLQRAREDRDAAEARQGQASRVAAWLSEERIEYMNRVDIRWFLNVANASQVPVYELHAWVGHPQAGTTDVQVRAAQVLPQRDTAVALSREDTERLRVSSPPRWEGAGRRGGSLPNAVGVPAAGRLSRRRRSLVATGRAWSAAGDD